MRAWRSDGRIGSAVAVAAIHIVLGYALVTGLGFEAGRLADEGLKLFDIALPTPEEPPLPPVLEPEEEDAGSAPDLKAEASPVVALEPKVRVPSVVAAAPEPMTGSDSSTGASDIAGSGDGSGGSGDGNGSGVGSGAKLIKGRIRNSDYPRRASRARAEGTVIARYTVGTDGRPFGCSVIRSSGNADLDAATCRLIEKRFRYRPARDAQGRPVAQDQGWKQVWWLEAKGSS